MNLAIDCTWYSDKKAPGYNNYIHSLLEGISGNPNFKSFNITIIYPVNQNILLDNFPDSNFNFKPIKVSGFISRLIWLFFMAGYVCRSYDCVLFTHGFCSLFGYFKKILVVHDLNYKFYPKNFGFFQLWFRRFYIPYSLLVSDKIICISQSVYSSLPLGVKVKSSVIYNSISFENLSDNKDVGCNIINLTKKLEGTIKILVPSSLAKHKNLGNALNSAVNILSCESDISFLFIGNWNFSEFVALRPSCELLIDKGIFPLGYVTESEKNYLFKSCNLVLIPSVFEGFGIPYIEAAYWRKVLVASNIPVCRELMGDYPIYINYPYDAIRMTASITEAIRFCRNNSSIKSFDLHSFGVEKMSDGYFEVIVGGGDE